MSKPTVGGHSIRCRIVIDTCADLSPEIAATLDVDILGFPYILDGVEYTDDIWSSITPHEFYEKLRQGAHASTSAVSLGRFVEFFTSCAEEGTPTVYLSFTAGLSSSYNSACQAADMVREQYPDFEIYVVDNCSPCGAAGLLALEAVRQRAAGLSARELAAWANEAKHYIHGFFTIDSLDALAAGGRIPPAAAQLSSKLDIKPEMSYDLSGSLTLVGVNRGRKKGLKALVKSFKENFKQGLGIWLIALVLIILEFMDFIIMKQLSGGIYTVVKYGLLVIALIMVMILQYVFPLLAKFVNTVKNTIRNALLMSLRHLPYTILMLLISIAPIVAMLFNTMIFSYGIPAYFLLGFSTLAFAKSYFFVKIFDKYIPKDESEEEEKDEDDWTIEGLREELEGSTEGTDSEETVSDETAAPADEKPENDDTTEQ